MSDPWERRRQAIEDGYRRGGARGGRAAEQAYNAGLRSRPIRPTPPPRRDTDDRKLKNYCFLLKEAIDDELKAWEADYPILESVAEDLGYHQDANTMKLITADEIKHWNWLREIFQKRCKLVQSEI